jgi:hypothetical protein
MHFGHFHVAGENDGDFAIEIAVVGEIQGFDILFKTARQIAARRPLKELTPFDLQDGLDVALALHGIDGHVLFAVDGVALQLSRAERDFQRMIFRASGNSDRFFDSAHHAHAPQRVENFTGVHRGGRQQREDAQDGERVGDWQENAFLDRGHDRQRGAAVDQVKNAPQENEQQEARGRTEREQPDGFEPD